MNPSSPFFTDSEIQSWINQKNALRHEDFDSRDQYLAALDDIDREIEDACRLGPIIPPA